MQQILSDSKREKFAYNEDKFIRVNLESNQGLLPVSEMSSSVDEYHQYFAEHDASNIYRLIFTINPICSNVLFNNVTEVVYNEGSNACVFFGKNGAKWKNNSSLLPNDLPETMTRYQKDMGGKEIKRYDLIEDTAYSHAKIGPLVYHCGADIFNNHTLRRKEFTVINKISSGVTDPNIRKNFNTIGDYQRTHRGLAAEDYRYRTDDTQRNFERHLYTMDMIKSFSLAIDEGLIENNGWFGFKNTVSLNIDNYTNSDGETIAINKCMNNNKAGEFIDMYPDRSLYSFIPKYNKSKDRLEYNWEYCLTYPYTSVTNNPLIYSSDFDYNGIECVPTITSDVHFGNENQIIPFKTYVTNNFMAGSKIRIAVFSGTTMSAETEASIPVVEVGNGGYDAKHYFSVRLSDILPLLNALTENDVINLADLDKKISFRCVKYVNGTRCKYYFRKFRKLPNFTGTDVYQDGNVTEEEIEKAIKNKKQVFNSTLNKAAFAENIYSDRIAEIVFNDDINTTGLKDNLGRDLSEIYLTLVKTNYGHNAWYKLKKYNDSSIEFSHCFGEITSGLDLENGKKDYNVHALHNIDKEKTYVNVDYIPVPGKPIENDITIGRETFFGDLVELSPYTLEETSLEKIYHRFNTAQREYCEDDNEFYDIFYDDIIFDDYDIPQQVLATDTGVTTDFRLRKVPYCTTGQTETLEDNTVVINKNQLTNDFPGNLMAEGYYYQAHYKIKLREYSNDTNWGSNQKVVFTIMSTNDDEHEYYIHTAKNYYFNVKDKIILYDKSNLKRLEGTITKVEGKFYTQITFTATLDEGKTLNDYMIFKINPIRPSTAYDLDDGTGRYVWRTFVPASAMTSDDELYDVPFVNGAHYIHKNINFYLRRQDPYGIYGLSFSFSKDGMPIPLLNLIVGGNEADVDTFEYLENPGKTC